MIFPNFQQIHKINNVKKFFEKYKLRYNRDYFMYKKNIMVIITNIILYLIITKALIDYINMFLNNDLEIYYIFVNVCY